MCSGRVVAPKKILFWREKNNPWIWVALTRKEDCRHTQMMRAASLLAVALLPLVATLPACGVRYAVPRSLVLGSRFAG